MKKNNPREIEDGKFQFKVSENTFKKIREKNYSTLKKEMTGKIKNA